jgi:very-short-patch-repair endonuclease
MAIARRAPQTHARPHPPAVQRVGDLSRDQRVTPRHAATAGIRVLAECQHGIVTMRQLIALGLSKRLILTRVAAGLLIPLHRGVFAVGHRRISRYGEWIAAVLACGPSAVLSYGSAAHLWGIRGSHGPIEVTRVSGHHRPHGVRLHQTRSLPDEDIAEEAGIPVTSLERMLVDMASRLDDRQMERALVEADRSGRLRFPRLEQVLNRSNGRKGVGRLRRLAQEVNPNAADAASPMEIDFLALCRRFDLPFPQVNVLVEGCLVDFYWPEARVIVETDGYLFHGNRPAFERDHENTVKLKAAGYEVLRATSRMLESQSAGFIQLVRDSLDSRTLNS